MVQDNKDQETRLRDQGNTLTSKTPSSECQRHQLPKVWEGMCPKCDEEYQEAKKRIAQVRFPDDVAQAKVKLLRPNQRKVVAKYLETPRGKLLIWGESGVGKSWAAAAMLRRFIMQGSRGTWLNVPAWVRRIKDRRLGERSFTVEASIAEILSGDYVVLDDLGAYDTGELGREAMYLLLTEYAAKSKDGMICTSNVGLEALSKIYDDRIASRLSDGLTQIQIEGEDMRQSRKDLAGQ